MNKIAVPKVLLVSLASFYPSVGSVHLLSLFMDISSVTTSKSLACIIYE
jgi:hypothetical protein